MRKTHLISAAMVAGLLSAPAFAQVGVNAGGALGGAVGGTPAQAAASAAGNVSGNANAQVHAPNTGAAAGAAEGLARSGAETAGQATGAAANTAAGANVAANVAADAANAHGSLTSGMSLRTQGGEALGQIVSVNKNSAGQVSSVVVQTADGARHSVPSTGLSVNGNAAITTATSGELMAMPRAE